jgi:hypothetical protein
MQPFTLAPKIRRTVTLACGLAMFVVPAAFAQSSVKSVEPPPPCTDQSPRLLENYDAESETSTVAPGADDTLIFTPRGGTPTTLHRCSQHYHCWIENLQPECPGQHATAAGGPAEGCPKLPPVDSWVEIHTVYSAEVGGSCDPETLACCTKGPFVVMGYHAKVTADTTPGPVPVQWGPPSAEWSGSNTGPDNPPGECKPIRAQWSFTLGCDLTVSLGQLGLFHHQDQARGLQPPERLSSDLTHVCVPLCVP